MITTIMYDFYLSSFYDFYVMFWLWVPYCIYPYDNKGWSTHSVKPPTEFNMAKNCGYFIVCSSGKISKGKAYCPLKVRIEEHRKAVVWGEIEK